MIRKLLSLLLVCLLLAGLFTGCREAMGEIFGNVADAATKELESSVKSAFQKYKVNIIEIKSAVGKLNGTEGDLQFFMAALVTSDSDSVPQSVADSLGKVFFDAGITIQTGSAIQSDYLQNKSLSYKFTDFQEDKTYYTVWFYMNHVPSLSDLKDLKNLLPSEANSGVG